MWTLTFWKAVVERAIKTFAQAAAAMLIGDGIGLLDINWLSVGSVAGLATVVSILTSVATAGLSDGNPSVASVEKLAPKA